jgi:hypothetical protein
VLGFDTEMSMDHNWLPYVALYLRAGDRERLGTAIRDIMARELPYTFRGFSTNWVTADNDPGTELHAYIETGPIRHRVYVVDLAEWVRTVTGYDMAGPPTLLDWLVIPEQLLLSLTSGRIYHDGLGVVRALRDRLATYPNDVWLYLLHAQWQRIGQEEPFVGRAGMAGDDAGSAIIAARLVRDMMRLGFLIERRYAPYSKHFGRAFAALASAETLLPILEGVLSAASWPEREQHLALASSYLAARFNALGMTPPAPTEITPFFDRPFRVIQGEAIARIAWNAIRDPEVKQLPYGVGKVDQVVDSTDVLTDPARFRALAALYTLGT